MKLTEILKSNRLLLAAYGAALAACIVWLCCGSKADIFLAINADFGKAVDGLMRLVSNGGTFTVIGPVCLILLLFVSCRKGLAATAAVCLSPVVTQFGKRVVWPDAPRPKILIEQLLAQNPDLQIHLVDGVHLHSSHSFPSGHTTGAFALFGTLALMAKKPLWKLFWLLLACLVGYSRMYLSQHFLIDVTVGSFIGMTAAVLCWWWLQHYRASWLDRPLIRCSRQTSA